MEHKVALVTGATSGIGASAARKLNAHGYTVYGLGRRADRLAELARDGIHTLEADLTDPGSLAAAAELVMTGAQRIDVLVNNAGYGALGSLEETSLAEGRQQFDVNLFGAVRLIQLVLPHMRAQGSGRIINVTSAGGKAHTPLGSWYHGTKFAMEGMSDALRYEVGQFGIDVVVIEPGATDTEWGSIAAEHVLRTSGSGPYAMQARALADSLASTRTTSRLSPPDVVAEAIVKAATAPQPRTRYAVGFGAKPVVTARRLLSDRAYDAMLERLSGVPRS